MGMLIASGVVFLIALAIRLAYAIQLSGTPLADVLLIDSGTYDRFARLILTGEFHGEHVYSMNVLYPYFLALVYWITGVTIQAVFLVQAVLDAINVVLIVLLGRRLFDMRVGILAGLMAAFYGPFVFYSGALLTPTLINFLCLSALVLLAREIDHPRIMTALAAGLSIGLATLGRGNSLLLVPLLLAVFRVARGGFRPALRQWFPVAAGAIALIAGVTVRNYLVEGKLVPVAANYAAFYIGHNPEATGLYVLPSFIDSADFESEVDGTVHAVSGIVGRPLTLAETAGWLFREGLRFARENPKRELVLAARKLYFFWNRTESPTNLNYYFARDFSPLLRSLPLHFGIIAPLGLLGIVFWRRSWRRHLVLHAHALVYVATGVVFFVSAEYRMPIVPVMLLFAGAGAVALAERVRDVARARSAPRPLLSLAGWLGLLGVLAVACNTATPLLRFQTLKRVDYLNFGRLYMNDGRWDRARAMLERSLAIDPHFGPAYAAMAELEHRLGRDIEALRFQELADRYRVGGQYRDSGAPPDTTLALLERAARLYAARDYHAAGESFSTLHGIYVSEGRPADARRMLNNVGLCQYRVGDLEEAERSFRAVIEADSAYVFAYTNLARVLAAQGRRAEAALLFDRALALEPDNPRVRQGYEAFQRGSGGVTDDDP